MKRNLLCILLVLGICTLQLNGCASKGSGTQNQARAGTAAQTDAGTDSSLTDADGDMDCETDNSSADAGADMNSETDNSGADMDSETDNSGADMDSETGNSDSDADTDSAAAFMAYITDFDTDTICADKIEWVTFPGSRAEDLDLTEDDAPSGFYIYNPDTASEPFSLPADCRITILDWENSYTPLQVSAEEFYSVLKERGGLNSGIPYNLQTAGNKITEISEHYVP